MWGLLRSLVSFHEVCFSESSEALKIAVVSWTVNHSKDVVQVMTLLPGKCTSAKTHKMVPRMCRDFGAS